DGSERDLALVAGDRSRELTQPEALLPGLGFDIWQPRMPAKVGTVMADSAAAKAGLKPGDEILKVDAQPIAGFNQLVAQVKPNPGREVTLEIRRDGQVTTLPIKIGESATGGRSTGMIGVTPVDQPLDTGRTAQDLFTLQKYGVFAAVGQAGAK